MRHPRLYLLKKEVFKRRKNHRQGFTLVAMILVISLLTVLIVAATVVAQIEEQAQYNASRVEVARQNALFGLKQALNQLQTAAGPDRRVTARADIITAAMTGSGTPPSVGPTNLGYAANSPATDGGQSFWTGVWKNTSNDYSGCAGNGLPDTMLNPPDPAPGKDPGPGGSFFYYDYTPDGNSNATATDEPLSPMTVPSRSQLYNNANVTWLISWPYSPSFAASPDPTAPLGSGANALPTTLKTRGGTISFPFSTANPTPSNANVATLITNLNAYTNQNQIAGATISSYINAPKVPILSNQPGTNNPVAVGTFAYWISDEGIKAKVNIQDPYIGTSVVGANGIAMSQAHFQIAQSNGVAEALQLNRATSPPQSTIPADFRQQISGDPPLIAPTLASMAYADTTESWSFFLSNTNAYSSDYTTDSYGVIADNFNGGLRRDLTAALENHILYQNQFGDVSGYESVRKVYSANAITQGACGVPDIANGSWTAKSNSICLDGLRWDSLYYYYNVYHTTMPSPLGSNNAEPPTLYGIGSQFNSECGGTTPKLYARVYEEPNPTGGVLDMDGFSPLLMYWDYSFGVDLNYVKGDSTSGYDYDFVIGESPSLILYNPFNVSLEQPPQSNIEIKSTIGSFIGTGTSPEQLQISGADSWGPVSINLPNPDLVTAPDPVPFASGELRLYSLAKDYVAPPTNGLVGSQTDAIAKFLGSGQICNANSSLFHTNTGNTSTTNELVSIQASSPQNMQQEEITSPTIPIHLSTPGNDKFTMLGTAKFGASGSQFNRINYYLWPASSSQGTTSSGNIDLPQTATTSITSTTISNSINTSPNVPDPTMMTVINMEDHVAGTDSTSFGSYGNPGNVLSGIGFPGLAAGGAALNPLDTNLNSYIRDYSNTGQNSGTSAYVSGSDLQTQPISVNGTWVNDTYWLPGSVGTSPTSQSQVILHDLPRQPLLSLGQFKNMYCNYAATPPSSSPVGTAYGFLGFSNYPLGGSYLAGIPTNMTFVNAGNLNPGGSGMPTAGVLLDDNFLANSVLFDGYFLSTVPPHRVVDAGNWQIPNADLFNQSDIDSNHPLPNSRLTYYDRPQSNIAPSQGNPPGNSNSPNILDLQCSDSATTNIRKPAANLLINGAFNINSTSVPAWSALLNSTLGPKAGQQLATFINKNNGTTTTISTVSLSTSDVPFLNFSLATGPAAWVGAPDNNAPWFGLVDLTPNTLKTLATNIVKQVQARGPFLSLGDFLNHRLRAVNTQTSDGSDALSTSGALQYAIDGWPSTAWPPASYVPGPINRQPSTSILAGMVNSTAHNSTNLPNLIFKNTGSYPPGFTQNLPPLNPVATGMGVPGTLLQNDLVQVIAPVISARSDTFTIRVYGQALGPTGASEAEAYCEAVVQRLPEYVYSTENGITDSSGNSNYAYDDPSPSIINTEGSGLNVLGLTTENSAFGRRFKIVSFRWLNKNEI